MITTADIEKAQKLTASISGVEALSAKLESAQTLEGNINAERLDASMEPASIRADIDNVHMVYIDVTPVEIAGEFFVPALSPVDSMGVAVINTSENMITVLGDYYSPAGVNMGDAFGDIMVPGNTSAQFVLDVPASAVTLHILTYGSTALTELWAQIIMMPTDDTDEWTDMRRPFVVNDDLPASTMIAKLNIVNAASWNMGFAIYNATGFNGQTARTISYSYRAYSKDGILLTEGSTDVPPGGFYSNNTVGLTPTLAGWGWVEVEYSGRPCESVIAHALYRDLGGTLYTHTFGYTEFRRASS